MNNDNNNNNKNSDEHNKPTGFFADKAYEHSSNTSTSNSTVSQSVEKQDNQSLPIEPYHTVTEKPVTKKPLLVVSH